MQAPIRISARAAPTEPQILGRSLYFTKLYVDSEFEVKHVRATRNHKLRAQTGNFNRRAQLVIPGRPDRTYPLFELVTKILLRNTQTQTHTAPLKPKVGYDGEM